jgi:hypothetical protein
MKKTRQTATRNLPLKEKDQKNTLKWFKKHYLLKLTYTGKIAKM